MNYTDYKRDLAVRIIRKIDGETDIIARIGKAMQALDEFLPKDDSPRRGHTEIIDLACVYEVDECPDCKSQDVEYTDVHPFCPECGYSFN
jgi:hypothetical protein